METAKLFSILLLGIMIKCPPAFAAVLDFENSVSSQGVNFGPDFAAYVVPQSSTHSGTRVLRNNIITEGWKECMITFINQDQRFVGAIVSVWEYSLQFRMYKDGKLVAVSAAQERTGPFFYTFLPSGYDGAVDAVGVWGYRGYVLLDDFEFTTIVRPPLPRRAAAEATVTNGKITSIVLKDPGEGYRTSPRIAIIDPTGEDVELVATVLSNRIQSISVLNPGKNYSAPKIYCDLPDFVPSKIFPIKAALEMNLDIGKDYQIHTSSDLKTWIPEGIPFTAETDFKSFEVQIQPSSLFYQLRRLSEP